MRARPGDVCGDPTPYSLTPPAFPPFSPPLPPPPRFRFRAVHGPRRWGRRGNPTKRRLLSSGVRGSVHAGYGAAAPVGSRGAGKELDAGGSGGGDDDVENRDAAGRARYWSAAGERRGAEADDEEETTSRRPGCVIAGSVEDWWTAALRAVERWRRRAGNVVFLACRTGKPVALLSPPFFPFGSLYICIFVSRVHSMLEGRRLGAPCGRIGPAAGQGTGNQYHDRPSCKLICSTKPMPSHGAPCLPFSQNPLPNYIAAAAAAVVAAAVDNDRRCISWTP